MGQTIRTTRPYDRSRAAVTAGVVLLHGLIALALLAAFEVRVPVSLHEAMTLVTLRPPPPAPVGAPKRTARAREAAAPPARRTEPVPLVAPQPLVDVPLIAPFPAAPVAAAGLDASVGSANAGPGAGAGGDGAGTGGGGDGGSHSQFRSGRIKTSDYPAAAEAAGIEGTVAAKVIVGTDGRVAACTIAESSGSPLLDEATCRLIAKRFRYKPGRDAAGRPVTDEWIEEQVWRLERREG